MWSLPSRSKRRPGARRPELRNLLLICVLLVPAVTNGGTKALSPQVFNTLTATQQQLDSEAWEEARMGLQKLLESRALSDYERAVSLQMLGYTHVSRQDYNAAVRAFEQSLALGQLPADTSQNLRYNLGQLYLTLNQPDKAIAILESWFREEDQPGAEAHVLLAHARAQKKQYSQAIPLLEKAIDLSSRPRAEWYETLLAMHYELRQYRASAPLLQRMIRLFPDRSRYWQQLAGVYMALNDQKAALASLELAGLSGALDSEQSLLQLAQLYLSNGVPYKAAQLMEQELRSGAIANTAPNRELLAHAWSAARERQQAIEALERALRDKAKPSLRVKLAQWYAEAERWTEVTEVLSPIESDDNEKLFSQARLLQGIAFYELGDTVASRAAFLEAREISTTRQAAQQWLEFIDSLPAADQV